MNTDLPAVAFEVVEIREPVNPPGKPPPKTPPSEIAKLERELADVKKAEKKRRIAANDVTEPQTVAHQVAESGRDIGTDSNADPSAIDIDVQIDEGTGDPIITDAILDQVEHPDLEANTEVVRLREEVARLGRLLDERNAQYSLLLTQKGGPVVTKASDTYVEDRKQALRRRELALMPIARIVALAQRLGDERSAKYLTKQVGRLNLVEQVVAEEAKQRLIRKGL